MSCGRHSLRTCDRQSWGAVTSEHTFENLKVLQLVVEVLRVRRERSQIVETVIVLDLGGPGAKAAQHLELIVGHAYEHWSW